MDKKAKTNFDLDEVSEENVEQLKAQKETAKFHTKSFNLDHTKVHAPYVRLADKKTGKNGDVVSKFDIRFCQPNFECMETGVIHALEHLMSEILHASYENVIDLSPMGCRTGFYLTLFGEVSEETIAQTVTQVLQKVVIWNKPIPGADEKSCGNYKDLDLIGAKKQAMMFIGGIMSKGYGC